VATGQSPTVRRRRLGHELHDLRERLGLTLDQAAARLEDISPAKISRIENGKVGARPRDVADLLDAYGVTEVQRRANLLTLARESRQRGWWVPFIDAMSPAQDLSIGLEAEAASLRLFNVQGVHGLLQTEAYARAVLRATWANESAEHVERRVELRMTRQEIIYQEEPPQVWSVLDESVLHRRVGGPEVLRDQLRRLVDLAGLPNVSIQVLPFASGAHAGSDGGFSIIDLPPPDPSVVYLEYRLGAVYLEHENEVDLYSTIFDQLRSRAMSSEESLACISKFARKTAR